MPPRSKAKRARRTEATPARKPNVGPAGKSPARADARPAKAKALAIREPVHREEAGQPVNAAGLERSLLDQQLNYISALMAWTPTRVLIAQHAAFWSGVSGGDGGRADAGRPALHDGASKSAETNAVRGRAKRRG